MAKKRIDSTNASTSIAINHFSDSYKFSRDIEPTFVDGVDTCKGSLTPLVTMSITEDMFRQIPIISSVYGPLFYKST